MVLLFGVGVPSLLDRASPVPGRAGGFEETCQLPRSDAETELSRGGGSRGKGPEDLPESASYSKRRKDGVAPHGGSCGEAGQAPGQVRSGIFRAVGLPRAGWTPFPLQTTEGMDQRVLEPQLHCWGLDTRILSGAGVHMEAQAKAKEDS